MVVETNVASKTREKVKVIVLDVVVVIIIVKLPLLVSQFVGHGD